MNDWKLEPVEPTDAELDALWKLENAGLMSHKARVEWVRAHRAAAPTAEPAHAPQVQREWLETAKDLLHKYQIAIIGTVKNPKADYSVDGTHAALLAHLAAYPAQHPATDYEHLRDQAENGITVHGIRGDTVSVSQTDLRALLAERDSLAQHPATGEPVAWLIDCSPSENMLTRSKASAEHWRDKFGYTIMPLYAAPVSVEDAAQERRDWRQVSARWHSPVEDAAQAADARRYRFLRDQKESLYHLFDADELGNFGAAVDLAAFPFGDDLDAAIDKIIAKDAES